MAAKVGGGPVDAADIQGVQRHGLRRVGVRSANGLPWRRSPGSEERPLDKAFLIHRLAGEPVTLTLEVVGAPDGFAVFESLEFVR